MDVYELVIAIIALITVTLLSVLAEMLGKAQETRRDATPDRRQPRPDVRPRQQVKASSSSVSSTRANVPQHREYLQPEACEPSGADLEQDR